MIRGFDRTDDYRVVCPSCKRDMGGTVTARPGHKVVELLCAVCEFGSVENQMRVFRQRLNDSSNPTA